MSDTTLPDDGNRPPAYLPPPAYPHAAPGASEPPQYPAAPQYPAPPAYGAAPQYQAQGQYPAAPYPYPAQKTNALSIVSLVASLVGIVWILPFIGSLAGVITGHIALRQLKTSGEKGRGMALAGTIVGWVGLGLVIVFGIIIVLAILATAANGTRYSS